MTRPCRVIAVPAGFITIYMCKNGRIAIYSRKSRFTGKGESIANQVELCRQYIRLHYGGEAADSAQVYEDEGYSGGSLERPQFRRMMAEARERRFGAVVVYRLDRISRNVGDFAGLAEELRVLGIEFISIREQFDTSSPMGRAMMNISSVFSQLERETIAERIRDNMRELAKTGRWLGGVTPIGYESECVARAAQDGRARRACRLRPVPEEMEAVKAIFNVFLETGSLARTEDHMAAQGYVTRRGKGFTRFAIRNILSNPVYMAADSEAYGYLAENGAELCTKAGDFDGEHGIMAYNRTVQQPGKAHVLRPMGEWIVSVGEHPGAVPGRDWVRAQALLGRNRPKGEYAPRGGTALLSGLIRCGNCGSPMRPKVYRQGEEGPVYAYLCTLKERSRCRLCAVKNPDGNMLDREVLAAVCGLDEDAGEFARRLERGGRELAQGRGAGEPARLERAIAEGEECIRGLVLKLGRADGELEGYILREIDELRQRRATLEGRLAELKGRGADPSGREAEALARRLSSFAGMAEFMTAGERRAAVELLVEEVVWDGEGARVALKGSGHERGSAGAEPQREHSK